MFNLLQNILPVFLLLAPASALALTAGEAAPNFDLPARSDGSISLSKLSGNVVYVDLWASWCGSCRKSFPLMTQLQEKYGSQGLKIVAVNIDKKRENAEKFLAELSPNFSIAFDPDGSVPKSYSMKTMPSSYVIDRSGKIERVIEGFHGESAQEIESAIQAALAQK